MTSSPIPRSRLAIAVGIVAVGVLAAAASVAFRDLLHLVYRAVLGNQDVLQGIASLPAWARVLLPAAGGAIAASLLPLGRRGNAGVGGVMEAVALQRGRISFRASLVRVAACFAAVASGGSIGREGPIIQLGAGIGDALGGSVSAPEAQRRTLVVAGTAAGFAAAYGTPLAAVLFVGEVVTISTSMRLVLPAAVAAVVAGIVGGFGPLYGARSFEIHAMVELVAFAGIGVAAGVVGVGFVWLLHAAERGFKHLGPPILRATIGGGIVGVISLGVPAVAGNGYEAIRGLLDAGMLATVVAIVFVAKAIATASSVGSGIPGGVFTPSLLLGAALGRLVALGLTACGAHVDVGAYAIIGMAATCAATTHAPLMASVMLLELTNESTLMVPLLLAATVATLTARALHRESLYTTELQRRGIPWPPRVIEVEEADAEGDEMQQRSR